MKGLLLLLGGMLATSNALAITQGPNLFADGSFEAFTKLHQPGATDGHWKLSNYAKVLSNAGKPANQRTPYGDKYARIATSPSVHASSVSLSQTVTLPKAGNYVLTYASQAQLPAGGQQCHYSMSLRPPGLTGSSNQHPKTKSVAVSSTNGWTTSQPWKVNLPAGKYVFTFVWYCEIQQTVYNLSVDRFQLFAV